LKLTLTKQASLEFISGQKPLDLKLRFENEGEFLVSQDEKGVVAVHISGNKGSVSLVDAIKQHKHTVDSTEYQRNMLDKLLIVTPNFALNQLSNKGILAQRYQEIKRFAKIGKTAFFCMSAGSGAFDTFILVGEPTDQKIWMLTLLHESGHAMNVANDYFENNPEDPKSLSKHERKGWSQALRLAKTIREKTGVDLLSIFGSRNELKKAMYSALLAYRASYAEEDGDDIADSESLFDKGKLNRLK